MAVVERVARPRARSRAGARSARRPRPPRRRRAVDHDLARAARPARRCRASVEELDERPRRSRRCPGHSGPSISTRGCRRGGPCSTRAGARPCGPRRRPRPASAVRRWRVDEVAVSAGMRGVPGRSTRTNVTPLRRPARAQAHRDLGAGVEADAPDLAFALDGALASGHLGASPPPGHERAYSAGCGTLRGGFDRAGRSRRPRDARRRAGGGAGRRAARPAGAGAASGAGGARQHRDHRVGDVQGGIGVEHRAHWTLRRPVAGSPPTAAPRRASRARSGCPAACGRTLRDRPAPRCRCISSARTYSRCAPARSTPSRT